MDINHDYTGEESFLIDGARERLQRIKSAILAFGDMGYTDPELPDLRLQIGEYLDSDGRYQVERAIMAILMDSSTVMESEIVSVNVDIDYAAKSFIAYIKLSFGTISITSDELGI